MTLQCLETQWPIFIYHGYHFDPDGLMEWSFPGSALLVSVRSNCLSSIHNADGISRHTNTSSHLPVLSNRSRKPLSIKQRTHPRDDRSHTCLYCICCYTGFENSSLPFALLLLTLPVCPRFISHCLSPLFFQGRTLSRIRRGFITPFLNFLRMLRKRKKFTSFLYGGTGV